jgi:hypothetical protein
MWKKLVLLGGLLACLGLPAFAAADVIVDGPVAKKTIPVELKGKLQKIVAEPNDVGPFLPGERDPKVFWKLLVDGKTYDLDLDNKHDLWVLAEKCVDQTVLVKGTWDGDKFHVASLKADVEHVKKTVTVEVKGRLTAIYPSALEVPLQPPEAKVPRDFPPYNPIPSWQIAVGDKTYALDLAPHAGAEGLLDRANELVGRTVILTGELENDTTIRVSGLQADDEHFKVTETRAEVKGKLQYVITHVVTGKVIMVCDALPQTESFNRTWVVNYGFVVDGQTYILDLHGDKSLGAHAHRALGLTVTASGVLNGDRLKVDSMSCDELPYWLEPILYGPESAK